MDNLGDINKQLEWLIPKEETRKAVGEFQKAFAAIAPTLPDLNAFRAMPVPPVNPLIVAAEANYASEFHRRLMKWINDFDASLDENHEVGVRLVNFGQTVVFHLRNIGFWNPSLMTFTGITDDGNPVDLIQHVSQISVLLMKLPRKDPSKPKRPIGFDSQDE